MKEVGKEVQHFSSKFSIVTYGIITDSLIVTSPFPYIIN